MFKNGEYVVHGSDGVCLIKEISSMSFSGAEKKDYYVLLPISKNSAVCFVPVTKNFSIRPLSSKDEIKKLFEDVEKIEPLEGCNIKMRYNIYKDELKNRTCLCYMRLLKTISLNCQKRSSSGKSLSATDEKFWKEAKSQLSTEIAAVFGIENEDAAEKINNLFGELSTKK